MKAVRYLIELYDKEVMKFVKYFKPTKQQSEPITSNNNAESGGNVLSDTTLAVVVSNNNEAKTDTDSEDEFLADITTAKEIATSTGIHGGTVIGTEVKKLFAGAGWFTRKVNKIDSSREYLYQVRFQEDGHFEVMSVGKILFLQKESSLAVSDVRFKFFHKMFHNIYAVEVVEIKRNRKWKCRFNDGEIKYYSLQKLQKCTRK